MKVEVSGLIGRDGASRLDQLVREEPAVLMEGPRGSGKSTLLRDLAKRRGGSLIDLDDDTALAYVLQDPAGAIASDGLVLIDEFQRAPSVLSAIKRAVDLDTRPGRFVLAGSVSSALLPTGTETLTGRVERMTLPTLSTGDVLGTKTRLIAVLLAGEVPKGRVSPLRRHDYFDLLVAGGYPAALRRSGKQRSRWYASYLGSVADRDLPELVDIRYPADVSRLYRLLAQQTSEIVVMAALGEALGFSATTARAYVDLLVSVHLVMELPGWTTGVSAKVGKRPKFHVTDTGLGAAAVGTDAKHLASRGMAGHFLETYVVGEIAKQIGLLDEAVLLAHFRDRSGIEVDLILERPDGSVIGVEVKAATAVNQADSVGLRFLQERLGERFALGVVFYTGEFAFQMAEGIVALPVSSLWGNATELRDVVDDAPAP